MCLDEKNIVVKWLAKNPLCVTCMKNGYYIKATAVVKNEHGELVSLCDKHVEKLYHCKLI